MLMGKRLQWVHEVRQKNMLVRQKLYGARQKPKLLHAHIFAARAFQAILTIWGVLDDFFDPEVTFINNRK